MSPPCSTQQNGRAADPAAPSSSRHEAAEHQDDTAPGRLDDPDVLRVANSAVSRLLRVAHRLHDDRLPAVGTRAWMAAGWVVQSATLAVCGLAVLLREDDLDLAVAERMKIASVAVAEGGRWVGHGPSRADLERRRAAAGPMARDVDTAAAARWAATGSSAEGAA